MSHTTKPAALAASFLAAALLLACHPAAAQRPGAERRVQSLAEILAAVPDSAMRARWIAAAAAGELPPLHTLAVPARPLTTRRRVVLQDTTVRRGARIPEGTVADVRLYLADSAEAYRGPLYVRGWRPGKIEGSLRDRRTPVEIAFKLPGGPSVLAAEDTAELELAARSEVVAGSHRRELRLASGGRTLLYFLSDGSEQPYRRDVPELGLAVRQLAPAAPDSASFLAVRVGGEELVLRPGDLRRVRVESGVLEIFLGATYYTEPGRVALAEGDPYHVTLMVFRRGGR